jgi:hypothetical protein
MNITLIHDPKKRQMRYLFMLIISFSFFSCKDDELTLKRQNYYGSELKINGFYTVQLFRNETINTYAYILYENGVVFYPGRIVGENIEDLKEFLSSASNYSYQITDKTSWGIFVVDGNSITIEKWCPARAYLHD